MKKIKVEHVLAGNLLREGAGVKLHRYIGMDRKNNFDPILLFDVFDSEDPMDYLAGFPAHPHRGFETITYMLEGQMEHRDNHGHHGIIGPGDVQWMTAGRGIIHSEMPKQSQGRLSGLQVWLNLPAAHKYDPPRYQEYTSAQFPLEQTADVHVKVIAGKTNNGTEAPIQGIVTAPIFLDITCSAGKQFTQDIPLSHQSIMFVLSGAVTVFDGEQNQVLEQGMLAGLSTGDCLTLTSEQSSRCLLLAAARIGEPVERAGPFVMNTREEILQAIDDFQNNRF
ncbi:pirin family protein [Legionella septentrionalis]|uniref:Pirin family protein n=1 Tax=Legionella septentrionalis TaxID=2498109 RepID=A0A433JM63_9GAMM|nr:pirin family protein [Legionella septentrionalis]RUQ91124.1 pirin family protein [Legionella septentrionalis]